MDPYTMERWMLERHKEMMSTAERRARIGAVGPPPIRSWVAGRLRSLADRLDEAPLGRAHRPIA